MPLQQTSGNVTQDAYGGGAAVVPTYVENVFSTYLYTGTGAPLSVQNNISFGTAYGGYISSVATGYLQSPSSSVFAFGTNDFTMEAWIYPVNATSIAGIVSTRVDASGSTSQCVLGVYNGQLFYYAGTLFSGGTVQLNAWSHVACSSQSGTIKVFLNGIQVATGTDGNSKTTTYGFVGCGGGAGAQLFKGQISNARIVNGTAIYTSNFTPSSTPLTAVSGTALLTCQSPNVVSDQSSNAFTLTIGGTLSQVSTSGPFTTLTNGGMVWIKSRTTNDSNFLFDTSQGAGYFTKSNSTSASTYDSDSLKSFNANGFSLGTGATNAIVNESGLNFASWTFRKQPKFFDVVTYTGTGSLQNINHNLGSTPGCIIIKCINTTGTWCVYHKGLNSGVNPEQYTIFLNLTNAQTANPSFWNNTAPTSTQFTVNTNGNVNANGNTYVAYLFASNAGGFGLTGTNNVITCGSYTGTGAGGLTINLGYEPQWFLVKEASAAGNDWYLMDSMRGFSLSGDQILNPNSSNAEFSVTNANGAPYPTSTGVAWSSGGTAGSNNVSGSSYIYIAIRRGPMAVPTDPTKVFKPVVQNASSLSTVTTGFVDDFTLGKENSSTTVGTPYEFDRLRGQTVSLSTSINVAEYNQTPNGYQYDHNTFFIDNFWNNLFGATDAITYWNFARAPGFFDIVCYTGTGSTQTITHNLGTAPQMIIVKSRSASGNWSVYNAFYNGGTNPQNYYTLLQTTSGQTANSGYWNNTAPTSSVFTVGTGTGTNSSGVTYVSYLFGTVSGVSYVGSYTGNGTGQSIACGFGASGARFILIKRVDSSGDWYCFDSANGLTSSSSPYLLWNSNVAQTTGNNGVYASSGGFTLGLNAALTVNIATANYIFLAIA